MDPSLQGFESEPFDPWTLSKYNYIASMFPVKREKAVKWDEDLEGLQDWDYWRRIVESGGKGQFLPGYGFWTELPDKSSISGQVGKRKERILKVREKHGDKQSDILIHGQIFHREAKVLAKTLEADYFNDPAYWVTGEYKLALTMGLLPQELETSSGVFGMLSANTKKAIYWTGYDADNFAMAPYVQVRALMGAINKEISHNFAMDDRTLGVLEDLGIKKTELLTFPREEGTPADSLPEKFKVLGWADDEHIPHLKTIAAAMPDVEFEFVDQNKPYKIPDYTVILQFTKAQKIETGTRNALMMGRYVISNVQAPYSGYVQMDDPAKFVSEVTEKIGALVGKKEINKEAQDYYLKDADPEAFKARIAEALK
jgi:hypothetical protein